MYHWHLPSLNIPMSCNNSNADGLLVTMAWFIWYTRNACRRHAFHLLFNNPSWAELFGRQKKYDFHKSLSMAHTYITYAMAADDRNLVYLGSYGHHAWLCLHLSSAVGWQFCSGSKNWAIFWRRFQIHFLDIYCLYFGSFVNGVCSVSFKLQSINEG